MLNTLSEETRETARAGFHDLYVKAFNWMLLSRILEEKIGNLWRAGKIAGGVYLGRGQEAISVAIGMMLKPGDIFGPLIRDQAGRLAFGEPIVDAFRSYLGLRTGPSHGRDGNVHRGRPGDGIYPMISHLGSLISVVAGALMARRIRGDTNSIGATSIGDGGTSTGSFHEGLNLAAVEKLPLLLVVTNNQYAYSTPNEKQFACQHLVDRAIGYGVEGHQLDGTNLDHCLTVIGYAAERARSGHGPQMVVASCLRQGGHAEHDDAWYVDQKLLTEPVGRDCLEAAESYLLNHRWADAGTIENWRTHARSQVEDALRSVQVEAASPLLEEDWRALSTQVFETRGPAS